MGDISDFGPDSGERSLCVTQVTNLRPASRASAPVFLYLENTAGRCECDAVDQGRVPQGAQTLAQKIPDPGPFASDFPCLGFIDRCHKPQMRNLLRSDTPECVFHLFNTQKSSWAGRQPGAGRKTRNIPSRQYEGFL
jgi:hypothetical protein